MNKRGISAVIATILMILIVVVGVGIVWKVIMPLFVELEFMSYSDVQLKIVRQGFTVYDSEKNFAFVQIERGEDEVNVTGVEIGFNFNGTTKTYQFSNVPTPNGKYTYKFNFTNDSDMGIPQNVTPNKVTVAPIFTINSKVRLGKVLDSEDMPVGRARLSAAEWEKANNESATAIVVTGGNNNEPGKPVNDDSDQGDDDVPPQGWINVSDCGILSENEKEYRLIVDLVVEVSDLDSNKVCFDITGDSIEFNLDSYSITASGINGTAISARDLEGIWIRNGEISGFNYSGIYFDNVIDSTVSDLFFQYNKDSVKAVSGGSNTFSDLSFDSTYVMAPLSSCNYDSGDASSCCFDHSCPPFQSCIPCDPTPTGVSLGLSQSTGNTLKDLDFQESVIAIGFSEVNDTTIEGITAEREMEVVLPGYSTLGDPTSFHFSKSFNVNFTDSTIGAGISISYGRVNILDISADALSISNGGGLYKDSSFCGKTIFDYYDVYSYMGPYFPAYYPTFENITCDVTDWAPRCVNSCP